MMRAPPCPDSNDVNHEEQGQNGSKTESEMNEIHALEKTLEKKQPSKAAVFGICLDILMGNSVQVPFVLSRLCRYIESHGLYHSSLFMESGEKGVVEKLRLEFVHSGDASLETEGNVQSASELLIMFFQELPEPLIPENFHAMIIKEIESQNVYQSIPQLKSLLSTLPNFTFITLKYLSRFLAQVVEYEEQNGMSPDNIGLIFGPLIFRIPAKDVKGVVSVKNVVKFLVSYYHQIFETDSKFHVMDPSSAKSSVISHETKARRQLPCPSSVMPVIPLEPLSVFIPSSDSNFETTNENIDDRNVPILLIESQIETLDKNKTNQMHVVESTLCKEKCGASSARKRKERRLSEEETQVQQHSSSEERPVSVESYSEKKEFPHHSGSHDEMKRTVKPEFEKQGKISNWDKNSLPVDSPNMVLEEKDHSPHPPNAKRREVEPIEAWNLNPVSETLDKSTPLEKPLTLDLSKCQYSFDQNSLSDSESSGSSMDCSVSKIEDKNDEQEGSSSRLMRSASCPVPNLENKNEQESDTNLSLSWSMLFDTDEAEPVRSVHRFNWPSAKDSSEEDTLLSPSVQSLRKSSLYEAPLSPSAYRSYLSYRSTHLDSSIPPSPPVEQEDFAKSLVEKSGVSDSIKQHMKKIHNLKKKIRRYDEKFENEFGYKPSHAEKANNPETRKMLSDLHKVRKELKVLKEESHLEHVSSGTSWHSHRESHILGDTTNCLPHDVVKDKTKPSLEDSVGETLKTLAEERRTSKRPDSVEEMTTDQVQEEKLSIQKALLNFESIHGKPSTKVDRNTIRPLYDRYRCVKRLLVRSGSFPATGTKKDICSELQPILEHETMDFTSPQHRTSMESLVTVAEKSEPEDTSLKSEASSDESQASVCLQLLTAKYNNSNIHELPLSEMIFQLQQSKSEKRRLRKILRDFEAEFQRLNTRKVEKEDKAPVEALYAEYKHVKARLKLLEALVSKHDHHQL